MTQNQIRYAEYLETKRGNLAKEQLTRESQTEARRHNLATESLDSEKLDETIRSNLATERNKQLVLNEQVRSNLAHENLTLMSNAINASRYAQEYAINSALALEQIRHNNATESITSSYNYGNLSIAQQQADTQKRKIINDYVNQMRELDIKQQQADTTALNYNRQYELESQRVDSTVRLQKSQTISNYVNAVRSGVGVFTDIAAQRNDNVRTRGQVLRDLTSVFAALPKASKAINSLAR